MNNRKNKSFNSETRYFSLDNRGNQFRGGYDHLLSEYERLLEVNSKLTKDLESSQVNLHISAMYGKRINREKKMLKNDYVKLAVRVKKLEVKNEGLELSLSDDRIKYKSLLIEHEFHVTRFLAH